MQLIVTLTLQTMQGIFPIPLQVFASFVLAFCDSNMFVRSLFVCLLPR